MNGLNPIKLRCCEEGLDPDIIITIVAPLNKSPASASLEGPVGGVPKRQHALGWGSYLRSEEIIGGE